MIFAVVGLVVVGVVTALNLVVLLVVLRRWRELETSGGGPQGHNSASLGESGIQSGGRIPRFSARALDGTEVTERSLLGREVLVGFFSLTCKACVEAVPHFAGHAERLRATGGTTLAIVHGVDSAQSELAAMLSAAVDVVIAEDSEAELSKQYGAKHFPSHARYGPDGVVTTAAAGVSALRRELVAS
ncbi:TlpA disulfide reductase family protein [Streptomyces sp. NPDC052236]|uniref:TlpA disulfide reductase family protein n=1 Tax=Streptomyces sp. NPDC052236 TaxID=3365686 RepID=UPI0037D194F7